MKITMSWADIDETSKRYVNDVLESGWISRHKYIPRLEDLVAQRHGAKFGIFTNSGTDALRIALLTLKETKKIKEREFVAVPALTFVATVNAVLQAGFQPFFVDVDAFTGNMDFSLIPNSVKAIVPVHLFGLPVAIPKTKIPIVEDSCETVGVHHLTGDMACFSFYMSHHITAGVGGMIVTNNPRYERVARSYMNHGRIDDGSHFKFGRIGYSSRATELEAALGCAAMERLDENLWKRRRIAGHYCDGFSSLTEDYKAKLSRPNFSDKHSWMFFPILLKEGNRDKLLAHLKSKGIESREAMPLINQPVYTGMYTKGSCPNAENWTNNGLLLPLHPLLEEKDVEYVVKAVKGFFH